MLYRIRYALKMKNSKYLCIFIKNKGVGRFENRPTKSLSQQTETGPQKPDTISALLSLSPCDHGTALWALAKLSLGKDRHEDQS
jgi:hypothetical protein